MVQIGRLLQRRFGSLGALELRSVESSLESVRLVTAFLGRFDQVDVNRSRENVGRAVKMALELTWASRTL